MKEKYEEFPGKQDELVNFIKEAKERLLKKRIQELNIDVDWEEEEKSYFKHFRWRNELNKETWYYIKDDTSPPQEIITFIIDYHQDFKIRLKYHYD